MTILLTAIAVMLCLGLVVATVSIVMDWHDALGDDDVRLSFRTFRKFYDIAPEKYNCRYYYIRYRIDRCQGQVIVMKTPIDYLKYVLWRRKIERRKATAESVKVTQKYLDSVRKDIENFKGGDTESNS